MTAVDPLVADLRVCREKTKPRTPRSRSGGEALRAKVDDRATHPDDFAVWNAEFDFTLDVAASAHNAKCPRYFDEQQDGLGRAWSGERVWCNPPYSDIGSWVAKAWHEVTTVAPAELVVMLLPANRTEQAWWQDFVEPHRDQPDGVGGGRTGRDAHLRVRFLRGRLRFIQSGRTEVGPNERPPFGCCLLVWRSNREAQR